MGLGEGFPQSGSHPGSERSLGSEPGSERNLGRGFVNFTVSARGLFRAPVWSEPGGKKSPFLFSFPPLVRLQRPKWVFGEDGGFLGSAAGTVDECLHILGRIKGEKKKSVKCGFFGRGCGPDVPPGLAAPPRLGGFGGLGCGWVTVSPAPGWGIWRRSWRGGSGTAAARRLSVSEGLGRAGERGAEGMLRFPAVILEGCRIPSWSRLGSNPRPLEPTAFKNKPILWVFSPIRARGCARVSGRAETRLQLKRQNSATAFGPRCPSPRQLCRTLPPRTRHVAAPLYFLAAGRCGSWGRFLAL